MVKPNPELREALDSFTRDQHRRAQLKRWGSRACWAVLALVFIYNLASWRVVSATLTTDPAGRPRLVLVRTRLGFWWDTAVRPAPPIDWGDR